MKIGILGTGWVGLVTGNCLANIGNDVTFYDIDENKISNLKNQICPIYEPGLQELILKNKDKTIYTTNPEEAIKDKDILFIAVGTPSDENGSVNLSFIKQISKTIGENLNPQNFCLILNKSTSPPEALEIIENEIKEVEKNGIKFDYEIGCCPETLAEGTAIKDFSNPDRIIVGINSEMAKGLVQKLFRPYTLNQAEIIFVGPKEASLAKYASNTHLAARVAVTNAIAQVARKYNANTREIMKAVGKDKRIGQKFLHPSIGFGGSCFPKDVQALAFLSKEKDLPGSVLLQEIINSNKTHTEHLTTDLITHFQNLENKNITILGTAFKANVSDTRDSPSHKLINALLKLNIKITVYDPKAMEETKKEFQDRIFYAENEDKAIENANALIIATEWDIFRSLNLEKVKTKMQPNPFFGDYRALYNKKEVEELGFKYFSV